MSVRSLALHVLGWVVRSPVWHFHFLSAPCIVTLDHVARQIPCK